PIAHIRANPWLLAGLLEDVRPSPISPLAFASIPLYAATAKASGAAPVDKPPGHRTVKGQAHTPRCDTMALENLNRLDYISRVTATGVRADRP
ncbi:hypothetical protein, partial [Mesorhizobium sp. M7A.F.Ca.CA.001.08.1.1]|uniref:hypothetical protein n=1 Tax=Mesorhizobium sp. M7A.F.Ca.CA.001.08.1.1 TaxID=2496691 RepID=UPI0019D063C8